MHFKVDEFPKEIVDIFNGTTKTYINDELEIKLEIDCTASGRLKKLSIDLDYDGTIRKLNIYTPDGYIGVSGNYIKREHIDLANSIFNEFLKL